MWTDQLIIVISLSAAAFGGHLNFNVCVWCDASSPTCGERGGRGERVCFSNCSLSSFCASPHDICVALWRETNASVSVRTMCHDPTRPLEGVRAAALRLNATSHECHMTTAAPATEGGLKVCACRGRHECNDELLFGRRHHRRAIGPSAAPGRDVIPALLVGLAPPVLVLVVAVALCRRRRRDGPPSPVGKDPAELPRTATPAVESHAPASAPVARLEAPVGGGRFARVWRARLPSQCPDGGSPVAAKVFPAARAASWRREAAILADAGAGHRNVVQFLGAQVRGGAYWLLLAYHGLGNLRDFLAAEVLDWERLLTMASGLARGLAHLHSDTLWPPGAPKVAVAHRDVKSSNVLLKDDGDVVLCDFGLAVQLRAELTADDLANSGQAGTARYMAPEALESRVSLRDGESFKQMDVYSMALVLWEMASRCRAIGEVDSYAPPFAAAAGERPCVNRMRDLVIGGRRRPDIPPGWSRHRGMATYCETVTECWDHDPEARLTALCVLERLRALRSRQRQEGRGGGAAVTAPSSAAGAGDAPGLTFDRAPDATPAAGGRTGGGEKQHV